jgi:23S rRNA U2552 (ribose-2'-O)-methylase RlmE/FtsJ
MSVDRLYEVYKKYAIYDPIGIGDKGTIHSYIELYGQELNHLSGKKVNLLEIGVAEGHSLKMWKEYFHEDSVILGLDIDYSRLKFKDINVLIGDVCDKKIIDILDSCTFDIIIDDGSHKLDDQLFAFDNYNLVYQKTDSIL